MTLVERLQVEVEEGRLPSLDLTSLTNENSRKKCRQNSLQRGFVTRRSLWAPMGNRVVGYMLKLPSLPGVSFPTPVRRYRRTIAAIITIIKWWLYSEIAYYTYFRLRLIAV